MALCEKCHIALRNLIGAIEPTFDPTMVTASQAAGECCPTCAWWKSYSLASARIFCENDEELSQFRDSTLEMLYQSACRVQAFMATVTSPLEPELALLVGSAARGESVSGSDVDFNFVMPEAELTDDPQKTWCVVRAERRNVYDGHVERIVGRAFGDLSSHPCAYKMLGLEHGFAYSQSELLGERSPERVRFVRYGDLANIALASVQIGGTIQQADLLRQAAYTYTPANLAIARLALAYKAANDDAKGRKDPAHWAHSICSGAYQVLSLILGQEAEKPYWAIADLKGLSARASKKLFLDFRQCVYMRVGQDAPEESFAPRIWHDLGVIISGELSQATRTAFGEDGFNILVGLFSDETSSVKRWDELVALHCG